MALALGQRHAPAQRMVEYVRAGDEDALFGHFQQHAPPVAQNRTEIPGDAGFDDRIVDVGDHREAGRLSRSKHVAIGALLPLRSGPVERHHFPAGTIFIGPVAFESDVEVDIAFLVGQPLVPPGLA